MLDLILLLILLWHFYLGYRRGLTRQLGKTLLFIVSFLVALLGYRELTDLLSLWVPYANPIRGSQALFFESAILFDLDQVFYSGLSFFFIFVAISLVGKMLSVFFELIPWKLNWDHPASDWLAGGLSFILTWFVLEMLVFILATVPLALVQDSLSSSAIVQFMMTLSPFSRFVLRPLWVTAILGGL